MRLGFFKACREDVDKICACLWRPGQGTAARLHEQFVPAHRAYECYLNRSLFRDPNIWSQIMNHIMYDKHCQYRFRNFICIKCCNNHWYLLGLAVRKWFCCWLLCRLSLRCCTKFTHFATKHLSGSVKKKGHVSKMYQFINPEYNLIKRVYSLYDFINF